MSLIGDLIGGAQTLGMQSKGVEIAGKNLANANNPAYARQRILLGDLGTIDTDIGAQSMGVQAMGIQQIRDTLLDTQVTREISQTQLFPSLPLPSSR